MHQMLLIFEKDVAILRNHETVDMKEGDGISKISSFCQQSA